MKLAAALLSVSIAVCSGCSVQRSAPESLALPDCPAPVAPDLPLLDASEPLESPANMERLMERDDRMRTYIAGLLAALSCWRARGGTEHGSD